jgi:hypothetical protein
MALAYYDEFIVCFRPRWEVIESIVRTKGAGGPSAAAERVAIRCRDGAAWVSGAVVKSLDAEALRMLAMLFAAITGRKFEEAGA